MSIKLTVPERECPKCGKFFKPKCWTQIVCSPGCRKFSWKSQLTGTPCARCGWHEAPCDLHRINPGAKGGEYTPENTIVLCPNCHRVEHRK
jgi:hypothetical protein